MARSTAEIAAPLFKEFGHLPLEIGLVHGTRPCAARRLRPCYASSKRGIAGIASGGPTRPVYDYTP
jgi:hypothetical protein